MGLLFFYPLELPSKYYDVLGKPSSEKMSHVEVGNSVQGKGSGDMTKIVILCGYSDRRVPYASKNRVTTAVWPGTTCGVTRQLTIGLAPRGTDLLADRCRETA